MAVAKRSLLYTAFALHLSLVKSTGKEISSWYKHWFFLCHTYRTNRNEPRLPYYEIDSASPAGQSRGRNLAVLG